MRTAVCLFLLLLLAACESATRMSTEPDQGEQLLVYIGTYTGGDGASQGIYASRLNTLTGELTSPQLAAEVVNPSFLAVHPNQRFLYAVGETGEWEGKPGGAVHALEINQDTGKLTLLNTVSSRGAAPCHLDVDDSGRSLVVANYTGGSVAAFPITDNGRLDEASAFVQHEGSSVDPKRQGGPHAHSVSISPDQRFVMAADLGLDKVLVYRFDPNKGSLEANDPPFAAVAPGSGPRHFAFHPSGQFAYVINEMTSTVKAFSYETGRGVLSEVRTISTLPEEFDGINHTAEVQVHPSGKFVYGSNRGHDSIAVFAVDSETGALTPVTRVSTQGDTPRNFGIDPTGSFLLAANQGTNNIVVFRIDQNTGRLTATGQELQLGAPVCVKFMQPGG